MTPSRSELIGSTVDTVEQLNVKVREAIALGRAGDAQDYASALRDASAAYRELVDAGDD